MDWTTVLIFWGVVAMLFGLTKLIRVESKKDREERKRLQTLLDEWSKTRDVC